MLFLLLIFFTLFWTHWNRPSKDGLGYCTDASNYATLYTSSKTIFLDSFRSKERPSLMTDTDRVNSRAAISTEKAPENSFLHIWRALAPFILYLRFFFLDVSMLMHAAAVETRLYIKQRTLDFFVLLLYCNKHQIHMTSFGK